MLTWLQCHYKLWYLFRDDLCNQRHSYKQAVPLSKYPRSEGLYCWDFYLLCFSRINSSLIAKLHFWKWNLFSFVSSLFHRLDSNGNQTGSILLTWPLSYLCARLIRASLWDDSVNTKVSLYHWPPVWLVRNQLYDNRQFLFLFAKQTNPNQSNRRSRVQWYFPPLVFPGWFINKIKATFVNR